MTNTKNGPATATIARHASVIAHRGIAARVCRYMERRGIKADVHEVERGG